MRSSGVPLVADLAGALAEVVGGAHVRGTPTGINVRPGTTEEAAAVLRAATEHGATVLPVGAGTTIDWAPAPATDVQLQLSRMDAILEHSAGDLVVHAQAGALLADVQAALAPHGQRLALSSPFDAGTIGGLVAFDLAGPQRYAHGTARDLVIGSTSVLADGTVAHSGGKVVKNVAGYDLGKLYTGSRGTLAVLTDVWFRLHPIPEATRWVIAQASDTTSAATALAAVRASQVAPTALQVRAHRGVIEIGVQLDGVTAGIDVRAEAVCALFDEFGSSVEDDRPAGWGALPETEVLLLLTYVPGALASVLDVLGMAAEVNGSAGVGVLHVGCELAEAAALLERARRVTATHHGHTVVLRAPAGAELDLWGPQDPALRALMLRVKDQFDPAHTLAPGRLPTGI
ncbi:MAG: FAD-binding oxidoreductase [Mycobacteriaceae bacterium]